MPRDLRYLIAFGSALVTFWLTPEAALACACCSDRAARYVAIEPLSASRLGEIERMDFAADAFVAETAADPVIDSQDFGSRLQLAVARTGKDMTFSFRDPRGRSATLTLELPGTISIFEVDPRGGTEDAGLGPVLYKEWLLTANASGTGVFRPLVVSGQKLTLILHGRGRGCTEASHFSDWTLQIQGPSGNLTLYGGLTSSSR